MRFIRTSVKPNQASNKSRWVFVITRKQPVKGWPFQQILQNRFISGIQSEATETHIYTPKNRFEKMATYLN